MTVILKGSVARGEEEIEDYSSRIKIYLSKSQQENDIEDENNVPFIMLIIIIILKSGVIGAALILVILRFAFGGPDFKPEWERFSLEIVSEKKNFTEAAAFCTKMSKTDAISSLAFFYTKKEEDYMHKMLVDLLKDVKMKEKSDECQNNFFVGMRKLVGEEWITADGNFIFGPDFLPNMFWLDEKANNEFCTALSVKHNFKIVQLPCQNNSNWNCFVCEHPCKSNETQNCFDLWNDKEVTNRIEAIEYCQMADVPGELMGISSTKLLNNLVEEVMNDVDLKSCTDLIAISNLFTLKYESIYEEPMAFNSNRFDININTNINKHCLVLDVKKFKWIFTNCPEKHCFICKITEGIQEHPDYPTN